MGIEFFPKLLHRLCQPCNAKKNAHEICNGISTQKRLSHEI